MVDVKKIPLEAIEAAIRRKKEQGMNIRPLSDRLVVEAIDPADKTPSGIILPDVAQGRATKGRVVAVGPGRLVPLENGDMKRVPVQAQVGDVVLFTPYAGHEVEIDGRELRIFSESEVMGVLEA